MTDFELLVYPHRAARKLPKPERFVAAVDWTEARLRKEFPDRDTVVQKLRAGISLSKKEIEFVIKKLAPKASVAGRPRALLHKSHEGFIS